MLSVFKMFKTEFSGDLGVRTGHFHCRGHGFNFGWETKIPQFVQCGQSKQASKQASKKETKRNYFIYGLH